jgi:hypothetical protein
MVVSSVAWMHIRDELLFSRKNSLELIELSSINKVSLIWVSSCSNTGSIRDDPNWTSRENSLELIELSSINKVSLIWVSSCSNTGSILDLLDF